MIMMKYLYSILLSVLLFLFKGNILTAQVTGAIKLPKPGMMKPGEYDTTALDKAELLSKETLGLVETPIDPAQYILGPNDILTVFIAPILY